MKKNQKLSGRVSNQETSPAAEKPSILTADEKKNLIGEHEKFPEIYKIRGSFKIKVKVDETDDDGKKTGEKVLYSRGYSDNDDKAVDYSKDGEPFEYYKVPSLVSALRYFGAVLDDSQIQFIGEGLKGSTETGKASAEILEILNSYLESSASRRRYSQVLDERTPMTDENKDNAMASSVRAFIKMTGASPEVAITQLKSLNPSPLTADYSVARFLANKGKR